MYPQSRARAFLGVFGFLLLAGCLSWSQQTHEGVRIVVRADQSDGENPPVWNFFGYDEPNYSYAPNGKKLLGEIAGLSPTPA
ncbi:MAG: hypothetical protein WCA27_02160 [Candidatus Sulfotelmatobacter sp.]